MLGVLANTSASISSWSYVQYGIFGLTAILLFSSLILVYCGQYPKTKSPNSSLIYFGTIANLKFDEFSKKFKESNDQEYLDDLLCQTHINAEILKKKFSFFKASLILIVVAIIPWLISIYLSREYLK
jgi:hypothetical protein